jgi:PAS domain S-box-containing protein
VLGYLKFVILFVWILLLQNDVFAQLYTFKKFDHKAGLSLSSILSVSQDQNGFIWLGTDGAGLIRFDGSSFDDLQALQGRNTKHVSGISFSKDNQLFFATEYNGFFRSTWSELIEIEGVSKMGRGMAIIPVDDYLITVQDAALSVIQNDKILTERRIYPFNESMHYYGHYLFEERVFIFTSRGNFVFFNGKLESLHDWLGTEDDLTADLIHVNYAGDSLLFVNKSLSHELTVLVDNFRPKFFVRDATVQQPKFSADEEIVKSAYCKSFSVFVSNKGRLFKRENGSSVFNEIMNNSDSEIFTPTSMLIDHNEDIWITSKLSGAFRVSLEPFTKLKFHPIYEDPRISFIGRTSNDDILLSTFLGKTFIGNRARNYGFDEYDLSVKSYVEVDGAVYLATAKGLKMLKDSKIIDAPVTFFNDKNLTLIHEFGGQLFIAEAAAGLYRLDLKTGRLESIKNSPGFVYTAVTSHDEQSIFFGSNTGVYRFDKANNQLFPISSKVNGVDLGSYAGNAIKDAHDNIWFTLDNGLMCILRDGTIKAVYEERFFPSYLFYSLNADLYGNLLVGTNKGITRLAVNEKGQILSSYTYNNENGFEGYETHMRSNYQDENGNIFVATLEGVFMIRPQFLEKKTKPSRPFIFGTTSSLGGSVIPTWEKNNFGENENSISIVFRSINAKNDFIKFSYRLVGKSDEWSEWSSEGVAFFNDLPSNDYIFEVRASMDGENISEVTSFSFVVHIPFYKSKWFILLGIALIIILNVFFLERTKSFNKNNIILSRDVTTDTKGIATILLFGAFANTTTHIFASRIDETIANHDLSTIIAGTFVFILFILVTFIPKYKAKSKEFLVLGFMVIMVQNFIGLYYSDLHPFFLMVILLTSMVAPFVFTTIKTSVAFAFVFILIGVGVVYSLENKNYNEFLFVAGICVAAFLAVFMTYIRNNSLEKLIFTSGVVNKGNALVIAFDSRGVISYSSENIHNILDIKTEDLKGTHVSEMNQFQPKFERENKFANVDLKSEFKEGKIFVTPLMTKSGDVVYYQWSCKQFSEEVRVILGQDVTDKINLENYYEIIVRNADDLIFQTDPQANLTFVNQKCVDVFKLDERDILGKPTSFIVHPDYKEQVKSFYKQQFLERKRTTYFEFPIIDGEGQERWLGQNVTTLFKPGADNIITGFLGLARDITERRKANAIIREQNLDITASINYARRIQFNLLPRSADFERVFDEFFILYRPKDIVSGDFYWLGEVDSKIILICSDSTGHGVPGSFMTLLGINLLNQIILEAKITCPAAILNELDKRLIDVLPRDGRNKIKDGMELVVCVFDPDDTKVEYASAGARFVLIDTHTDEVAVLKGDQKHIGDVLDGQENFNYSLHQFEYEDHQSLYLFTDGYPDQFGGDRNKKLTFKKYIALLEGICNQPMTQQNQILKEHLKEWIGEYLQTDDITVIGIKGLKK